MSSRMKSLALAFFLVCFAVMQIASVSPVMADSPPVLNANTDPKILREYVKKSDEIIKAKGGKAEYYATKAQLLEWLKDYRGAVTEYSKALEKKPNNLDYLVCRARNSRFLNNLKGAESDYSAAISLGDNTAESFTGRALVRLSAGNYTGAILDAKKAIKINPLEELAWYAKGRSEATLGFWKSSLQSINEAIKLRPGDPDFHLVRSKVYKDLGDQLRANEDYARYRQLSKKL